MAARNQARVIIAVIKVTYICLQSGCGHEFETGIGRRPKLIQVEIPDEFNI